MPRIKTLFKFRGIFHEKKSDDYCAGAFCQNSPKHRRLNNLNRKRASPGMRAVIHIICVNIGI